MPIRALRQYRRLTELVSSVIALSVVLAACGSSGSSVSNPANSKAITGGTFIDQATFDGGSPAHIDPALATDAASGQIASMLFDGLTKTNAKGNIVPAVATSWKANADNTEWTFTLRSDVKYSDGTPVTAQSFVDGWVRDRAAAEQAKVSTPLELLGDPAEDLAFGSRSAIAKATSSTELIVTLFKATPDFPAMVSGPQFAPTQSNFSETSPIVGNGEFVLSTAWIPGQSITLKRNDSYYGQKPYVDAVTFQVPKDNQSARDAVALKSADDAVVAPTGYKNLNANQRQTTVISALTATEYWAFNDANVAVGGTDNFLLRRAIATALDRKDIDLEQFDNVYAPATGWAAPSTPGYQIRLDSGDRNVEAAKDLLKEWGQTPPAINIQFPSTAEAIAEATTIRTDLTDIGITSTLQPMSASDFQTAVATGQVQFFYGMWQAPVQSYDSVLSPFVTDAPANVFKYSDTQFDGDINNARKASSTSDQIRYYQQAEATLLADQPVVPMEWPGSEIITTSRVQNLAMNPLGYIDFGNVWLKAS